MKIRIIVGLISLFIWTSCDTTYQYDVYVQNNTGEIIEIAFKTNKDKQGILKGSTSLEDGERQMIISTVNIPSDGPALGASADHCDLVAEYVRAFIRDSIQSNLKWCDPAIEYATVDVQQGEFIIQYEKEHFGLD